MSKRCICADHIAYFELFLLAEDEKIPNNTIFVYLRFVFGVLILICAKFWQL